ncbi:DNA replication licensing factor MCM9-like protein [Perkinsela sp. CCAP 1560/4]|nr:DNA replication licensing factor MCM9-like protein [Perkinsela sp. CCAP 1560/4]|eukprot:KNH09443.1 DNA replication licensing factor MCM9-like protein [Perkinsela sp. CCAP 1560/4]
MSVQQPTVNTKDIQDAAVRFLKHSCTEQIRTALDNKNAIMQSKHSAIFSSTSGERCEGESPMPTIASVFLPLRIDYIELAALEPYLAQCLVYEPRKCLDEISTMALHVQREIVSHSNASLDENEPIDSNVLMKCTQAQVIDPDTPNTPTFTYEGFTIRLLHFITPIRSLHSLRSRDIGQLVKVRGVVSVISEKKVVLVERDYLCTKCAKVTRIRADIAQRYRLQVPQLCEYCLSKREEKAAFTVDPSNKTINFRSNKKSQNSNAASLGECFQQIEAQKERWMDFQEIKISDRQYISKDSSEWVSSRFYTVVLQRDLVDCIEMGQEVAVLAIPVMQWLTPPYHGTACIPKLVLFANDIESLSSNQVSPENLYDVVHGRLVSREFIKGHCAPKNLSQRDSFVNSLFPSIHGLFHIKLALVLVLIGGVRRSSDDGVQRRGTSHILIDGAASVGKTSLLKQALFLSSLKLKGRGGALITGTGATVAGLTAAAVRESTDSESSWHLEAGALVLSNGGVCCIDDFHKLARPVRLALLEAMEQQHVSVAKAGMVRTLPAEASVIAATTSASPNADPFTGKSKSSVFEMNLPLLSRFDLVFSIADTATSESDRELVEFFFREVEGNRDEERIELRCSYVRRVSSMPTEIAESLHPLLIQYYERLERVHSAQGCGMLGSGESPITVRVLESLIRLTQAHARLMNRTVATQEDALAVIALYEHSALGSCMLRDFPIDTAGMSTELLEHTLRELQ